MKQIPRQGVSATQQGAENQVKSMRKVFVQRVSEPILHELLDELLDKDVITYEEFSAAKGEKHTVEKARHIVDMVWKKGNMARSVMMDMIIQLDHNLSEVLQLKPPPTD